MIEIVDEQFLFYEDDIALLYPGADNDDYLLFIELENDVIVRLSTGTKTVKHEINISKLPPLELDFIKQSCIEQYPFTLPVLNYALANNRISISF